METEIGKLLNTKTTYKDLVASKLLNIFMEVDKISEKDFARVDKGIDRCKAVCDLPDMQPLIESFDQAGARAELCAEIIYWKVGRQFSSTL